MPRRLLLQLWLAGCLCLGASGCLFTRYEEGEPIELDHVARIVPGKTTKAEILDWFGAPQGMADAQLLEAFLVDRDLSPGPVVDLPFADVLVFRLTRGRVRGLIFIAFNWFDIRVASDTLVVFFDGEDRVKYFGLQRGADALE